MRFPKGWNLAQSAEHPACVNDENGRPQPIGNVRVHILTRTIGKDDPQVVAALAWRGDDGDDRFRELSDDDFYEGCPPPTLRLDLSSGTQEVWSFDPPLKGRRKAA